MLLTRLLNVSNGSSFSLLQGVLLAFVLSLPAALAYSADQQRVEQLMQQQDAPEGVVFELIGRDGAYLDSALKKVEQYTQTLKSRFPGIEIAVVSHGSEQFALTTKKAATHKQAHQRVKKLVDDDITVHVCETHASWRGVTAEDFPGYIDVAPQGPEQIRQYEELGFIKIVVD